jgi:hypothetical protein
MSGAEDSSAGVGGPNLDAEVGIKTKCTRWYAGGRETCVPVSTSKSLRRRHGYVYFTKASIRRPKKWDDGSRRPPERVGMEQYICAFLLTILCACAHASADTVGVTISIFCSSTTTSYARDSRREPSKSTKYWYEKRAVYASGASKTTETREILSWTGLCQTDACL